MFMLINGVQLKKNTLIKIYNQLDEQPDYTKEKVSIKRVKPRQYIKIFIPIGVTVFLSSLVFFRTLGSAVFLTILSSVYPYILSKQREKKMRKLLNYQLREALHALSASLRAGSSLNNALSRTYVDLSKIFVAEKHKPIVDEFSIIAYELDLMIPVDEVLMNFKERANLEDINDFVNVTLMTRKQGGNLNEVVARITDIISDRIEVEHEINTLVAGKQYEARILTMLPVVLVVLLSYMSPDYMSPMYESMLGKTLMVIGALLLFVNYIVGKKIIEIEV